MARPGKSVSATALSDASPARAATSARPWLSTRFVIAVPTFPSRTIRSVTTQFSISVGWWTSEDAKRARPDRSLSTSASASSPSAARNASAATSCTSIAGAFADADLDVAEAARGRAVRHACDLPRLALAAVRQALHAPGLRPATASSEPQNSGVIPV